MALDDPTTGRLEYLIQQLMDSRLTDEERAQLESLLAAHDYLESQLLHEIEVESSLRNLNDTFDISERVMQRIRTHLAAPENARTAAAGSHGWRNTLTRAGRHPWKTAGALVVATALIVCGSLALSRHSAAGTMTLQEGISEGPSAQTLSTPGQPINLNGASHVGLARDTSASVVCRNGVRLELAL
jgi:hypothetical protein